MSTPAISVRRTIRGVLAFAVVVASVSGAASPVAGAAPADCTAAGLASTASGVLSQAGTYLQGHPDADNVLTAAAGQPPDQARSSVQGYFIGHPGEFFDLQNIAQPLLSMRDRCGVATSPTQLAALFDAIAGSRD